MNCLETHQACASTIISTSLCSMLRIYRDLWEQQHIAASFDLAHVSVQYCCLCHSLFEYFIDSTFRGTPRDAWYSSHHMQPCVKCPFNLDEVSLFRTLCHDDRTGDSHQTGLLVASRPPQLRKIEILVLSVQIHRPGCTALSLH